jgi:hypothetical protein
MSMFAETETLTTVYRLLTSEHTFLFSVYICIYIEMAAYIYVYISIYLYIYIYIYIFISIYMCGGHANAAPSTQ